MQDFLSVGLKAREGDVTNCRYYPASNPQRAVIMVGGIGGDFDTPASNLYPKLAIKLADEGISALRVQFRFPTNFEESVEDVWAGARFLENEGAERLGLVGHSFGGAVVIRAGTKLGYVKTIVALATQGFGTQDVAELSPRASILLIHGSKDRTLSTENSRIVYRLAKEPKKLVILDCNGHGLEESSEQVFELVHNWLSAELS